MFVLDTTLPFLPVVLLSSVSLANTFVMVSLTWTRYKPQPNLFRSMYVCKTNWYSTLFSLPTLHLTKSSLGFVVSFVSKRLVTVVLSIPRLLDV